MKQKFECYFTTGNHEQLEHATVYAGNYSTTVNPSVNMTNVYVVPNMTNKRHFTKELAAPIIAQFILVHLAQPVMTLCELRLYKKGNKFQNINLFIGKRTLLVELSQ
jgi:hypothetical protein